MGRIKNYSLCLAGFVFIIDFLLVNCNIEGYERIRISTVEWRRHFNKSNQCLITGVTSDEFTTQECFKKWIVIKDINLCFESNETLPYQYDSTYEHCLILSNETRKNIIFEVEKHYLCEMQCYVPINSSADEEEAPILQENIEEVIGRKAYQIQVGQGVSIEPFKDKLIGRTDLQEQQTLTDQGPVSDRKGGVIMKGAYRDAHGNYNLWFLTLRPSSWLQVSPVSSHRYETSKPLHRTNRFLALFVQRFSVEEDTSMVTSTFKLPKRPESSIKIDISNDEDQGCFSENSLVEIEKIGFEPEITHKNFMVCLNGSVEETDLTVMKRKNCTMFYINKEYIKCEHKVTTCNIEDSHKSENDKFLISLSLQGKGNVKIQSDLEKKTMFCNRECSIEVKSTKNVKVICPDMSVRIFHIIDDLSKDCPLISYWFSSQIAAALCRMTFRPWWALVLILWISSGMNLIMILIDAFDLLLVFFTFLVSKCKSRMGANYNYCEHCKTRIEFDGLKECHETCCKCTCPYCRNSLKSLEELQIHAIDCTFRIAKIDAARKKEIGEWKSERSLETSRRFLYKQTTSRVSYFMVIVCLLMFVIYPVNSQFVEVTDDWEEFKKEIESCGTECWRTSLQCECPTDSYKGSRVLLSVVSPNAVTSGYMDFNGTFQITDSRKIVDLTFTTSARSKGSVLISGNSLIDLPIVPGTGITWKVGGLEDTESKSVSLGVYESAQIYSAVFKFYTADRKIKTGQEFECQSDCTNNCGCFMSTCKRRVYNNDRAWNCNPTWCWSWGTGCTCCYAHATFSDSKFLFGIWELKYERTELVLCLNYDHPKYTYFNINEGGSFKIDNFNIKVSNIFGIDKKLPKTVASIHKKHNAAFDLENPDDLILDPEIKNPNSAVHGEVGDISFFSFSDYISKDQKNINLKWSGVSIDRTCTTGQYPTCNYQGVVEDNSELFENLIETSESIHTDYHTLTLKHDMKQNDLKVKVRPYKGAGQLQISLTVKNLELKRIEKKLTISTFKITKCIGCRGCHSGFWCIIKISLREPERFSLHLRPSNNDFVLETTNIVAKNIMVTYNISGYTPIVMKEIKICIEETNDCASTESITLSEPVRMLVAREQILISTTDKRKHEESDFFSNLFYGCKKFIFGFFDLLSSIFSSWRVVLTIVIILLLSALFLFTRFGRLFLCFCPSFLIKHWEKRQNYIRRLQKKANSKLISVKYDKKNEENVSLINKKEDSAESMSPNTPTSAPNNSRKFHNPYRIDLFA